MLWSPRFIAGRRKLANISYASFQSSKAKSLGHIIRKMKSPTPSVGSEGPDSSTKLDRAAPTLAWGAETPDWDMSLARRALSWWIFALAWTSFPRWSIEGAGMVTITFGQLVALTFGILFEVGASAMSAPSALFKVGESVTSVRGCLPQPTGEPRVLFFFETFSSSYKALGSIFVIRHSKMSLVTKRIEKRERVGAKQMDHTYLEGWTC